MLTGAQSDDAGYGATGSMLAGHLGWPHAWLVMGVELEDGGSAAKGTREMEAGMNEVFRLSLPAVIEIQAGLNHRRQLEAEDLVHAAFHLTRHLGRPVLELDAHHQPGVGPSQVAGQHRAGGAVAGVVGLGAGEHQVGLLGLDRRRQGAGGGGGVAPQERFVLEVHRAHRAERQALAQRLLHTLRPEADHHHLAAGLLRQLQPFFESVAVAFVDHERQVVFVDPPAVRRDPQTCLRIGHLLDTDSNSHTDSPCRNFFRRRT